MRNLYGKLILDIQDNFGYTNSMISTISARPHRKVFRHMPELTISQAADVMGQHRTTVWHWIKGGILPARQHGRRGDWQINVNTLREFAQKYNYKFDDEMVKKLIGN